jgi:hypothetical protein
MKKDISPATLILSKIRGGLTIKQLEGLIKDQSTPLPIFMAALQGFDRYKKVIERLKSILTK